MEKLLQENLLLRLVVDPTLQVDRLLLVMHDRALGSSPEVLSPYPTNIALQAARSSSSGFSSPTAFYSPSAVRVPKRRRSDDVVSKYLEAKLQRMDREPASVDAPIQKSMRAILQRLDEKDYDGDRVTPSEQFQIATCLSHLRDQNEVYCISQYSRSLFRFWIDSITNNE